MGRNNRLSSLPLSLKVLITSFLLALLLGYGVAVLQVYDRTHFEVMQTLLYYRGAEGGEEAAVLLPQSFRTLLSVSHIHTLSQPLMLVLVGLVFALSAVPEGAKVIFILLSFLGSVAGNLAPWLIRYLSRKAVILLPISQAVLLISFFVMAFVVLYELWGKKGEGEDYV